MRGFDVSTYGERMADVYDDWYADVSDVDDTVATVAALAGNGPVLELGVGTGRLALPLVASGLEVHGIEASPAMVRRLRSKPGGASVTLVEGDFAEVGATVPGGFAVVLVAFNTFFNLTSEREQRRCMVNVAAALRPGGAFVVEAFVPDDAAVPSSGVAATTVEADLVVLSVFRRDEAAGTVAGSAVSISEAGIRLRPWHIRPVPPDELDGMAAAAGLALADRWSGWHGEPFDGDSTHHVSVYRRGTG